MNSSHVLDSFIRISGNCFNTEVFFEVILFGLTQNVSFCHNFKIPCEKIEAYNFGDRQFAVIFELLLQKLPVINDNKP